MKIRVAGLVLATVLVLAVTVQAPSAAPRHARAADATADISHTVRAVGAAAAVSYGSGPLLNSNRTHVIFWQPSGSNLAFDPGYRPLVERFLRDVALASHSTQNVFALTGQYADYSGHPAAYASRYGGAVLDTDRLPPTQCTEPPVAGPGWTICLTDAELQNELEHIVHARHMPTTQHDVYFLVTPRGLGSCMGTTATSGCALAGRVNGYCGYHRYTNDGQVDYAFIPYNAVAGHCQSNNPRPNGSTADPALSTIGHELAETITDPDGTGWTDSSGEEIADLCITQFGPAIGGSGARAYNENIAGGHFYLQELWSNANNACEPRAKPDHVSFSIDVRTGRTLAFKGRGSDPEGRILSYHWLFGDGDTASGQTVTHRFGARGSYPVRLRVTDSWDNWGVFTRAVPVR